MLVLVLVLLTRIYILEYNHHLNRKDFKKSFKITKIYKIIIHITLTPPTTRTAEFNLNLDLISDSVRADNKCSTDKLQLHYTRFKK